MVETLRATTRKLGMERKRGCGREKEWSGAGEEREANGRERFCRLLYGGFWVYTVFRLAGVSVQRTRVYARVRSRVPRRARGCFAITYHYSAWLLQLQPRALFATRLPFVTLLSLSLSLSVSTLCRCHR